MLIHNELKEKKGSYAFNDYSTSFIASSLGTATRVSVDSISPRLKRNFTIVYGVFKRNNSFQPHWIALSTQTPRQANRQACPIRP